MASRGDGFCRRAVGTPGLEATAGAYEPFSARRRPAEIARWHASRNSRQISILASTSAAAVRVMRSGRHHALCDGPVAASSNFATTANPTVSATVIPAPTAAWDNRFGKALDVGTASRNDPTAARDDFKCRERPLPAGSRCTPTRPPPSEMPGRGLEVSAPRPHSLLSAPRSSCMPQSSDECTSGHTLDGALMTTPSLTMLRGRSGFRLLQRWGMA